MEIILINQNRDTSSKIKRYAYLSGCLIIEKESLELGLEILKARKSKIKIIIINNIDKRLKEFVNQFRLVEPTLFFIFLVNDFKALNFLSNSTVYKDTPSNFNYLNFIDAMLKYNNCVSLGLVKGLLLFNEENLSLEISQDIANITEVAEFLVQRSRSIITAENRSTVSLGLYELLINAIEHGNLNISYKMKESLLNKGECEYMSAVKERAKKKEFIKKKIKIQFKKLADKCIWIIEDEGQGFEEKNIPEHKSINGELRLSGRGIKICKNIFDKLHFTEGGKKVIAEINRKFK